jgi:hypothetical protein
MGNLGCLRKIMTTTKKIIMIVKMKMNVHELFFTFRGLGNAVTLSVHVCVIANVAATDPSKEVLL